MPAPIPNVFSRPLVNVPHLLLVVLLVALGSAGGPNPEDDPTSHPLPSSLPVIRPVPSLNVMRL